MRIRILVLCALSVTACSIPLPATLPEPAHVAAVAVVRTVAPEAPPAPVWPYPAQESAR